ncbi:hypothetical protein XENOCAPTIV_015548 [Xenoophorus captivus]|uniref:Uncharacterized protein n=1 Tax=Xenoophorus captivus TaxID=1517983 RepID=A0ABV0S0N7_9TELE
MSQSFVNFVLTPAFFPSQGDFTWSSLSGQSVRLTPVAIQSLSELERARLQEVAYTRLLQDYDLGGQITIPKEKQTPKSLTKSHLWSVFQDVMKRQIQRDQVMGGRGQVQDFNLFKLISTSTGVFIKTTSYLSFFNCIVMLFIWKAMSSFFVFLLVGLELTQEVSAGSLLDTNPTWWRPVVLKH